MYVRSLISMSTIYVFISFFLQVLFRYSKLGPIPKFDNLTRLQAAPFSSMLELFPAFLESFPNLQNLILVRIFDLVSKEYIYC